VVCLCVRTLACANPCLYHVACPQKVVPAVPTLNLPARNTLAHLARVLVLKQYCAWWRMAACAGWCLLSLSSHSSGHLHFLSLLFHFLLHHHHHHDQQKQSQRSSRSSHSSHSLMGLNGGMVFAWMSLVVHIRQIYRYSQFITFLDKNGSGPALHMKNIIQHYRA
jgi:hypothetical protein